jgi:hypothetical protein
VLETFGAATTGHTLSQNSMFGIVDEQTVSDHGLHFKAAKVRERIKMA